MSEDIGGCQSRVGWGISWHLVGRGQGAAKHPAVPRTAPNRKDDLAQSVSIAKLEKT